MLSKIKQMKNIGTETFLPTMDGDLFFTQI